MTFAPGRPGPGKSNRERFFDEDAVAMPNWLIDRARKLAYIVGGELEPMLNSVADEWEKQLTSSDLALSNSPIVSAIAKFFVEHGSAELRGTIKRTFIGMSEEYGEDANARARGARPGYEGHLITVNAEMEYDLARAADLYSAYVHLAGVARDAAGSEMLLAIKLVLLCLDIAGYRKPLTPDAFDWLPDDVRADFDTRAGEFLIWGMAFVLGHELGHHALGHTGAGRSEEQLLDRHQSELDADAFAVQGMFESARDLPDGRPAWLLAGPLVALTALALEQADGVAASETHPSPAERWAKVSRAVAVLVEPDEHDALVSLFEGVNDYLMRHLETWPRKWWP
jgi:hypothetical protein